MRLGFAGIIEQPDADGAGNRLRVTIAHYHHILIDAQRAFSAVDVFVAEILCLGAVGPLIQVKGAERSLETDLQR